MNNGYAIETRDPRRVHRVGKGEVRALRGVDLRVKRGEFLAVVGPSGSGKSTLFHIIGGLTPPTGGQGLVDVKDSPFPHRRTTVSPPRTCALFFQKFNLLPNLPARHNIAVARFIAGLPPKPDPQF